jgi:hypothetical protein
LPAGEDTFASVLTPQGSRVATVSVPKDLVVFEVGHDFILGYYEDDIDEPHVVLYPLTR